MKGICVRFVIVFVSPGRALALLYYWNMRAEDDDIKPSPLLEVYPNKYCQFVKSFNKLVGLMALGVVIHSFSRLPRKHFWLH